MTIYSGTTPPPLITIGYVTIMPCERSHKRKFPTTPLLRTSLCFSFYQNLFSGIVYSIMSNKTLPYHRIRDQIGTSVSFDIKNGNPPPPPPKCWHFEDDCVPNGSTGKVAAWGVLIYS